MSKTLEGMNTPAMKQYAEIKQKYPDAILFFRMGDFYEMFQDDAIIASSILDIALTKRQNQIPMCGFPYHATETYISRLIAANKKVVICEQIKNDDNSTKLLTREVVRVVSPGTVVEENLLKGFKNNFFATILFSENSFYAAFADVSTSDLFYCCYSIEDADKIRNTVTKFSPSEIILIDTQQDKFYNILEKPNCLVSLIFDTSLEHNLEKSADYYSRLKLLVDYIIKENFKSLSFEFKSPIILDENEYLEIDEQSARNLDLVENQNSRDRQFTLFSVLNKCSTGIGKRTLMNRILFPNRNKLKIQETWEKIDRLSNNPKMNKQAIHLLESFSDIERILSRFRAGKTLPRDFRSICRNIEITKLLKDCLASIQYNFIYPQAKLEKLSNYILDRLSEGELPAVLGGGEFLKPNFDTELDKARESKTKGKDWILEIEEKEKSKTGLNTLKIRYNKVVGYYIELSRAQAASAPPHFLKKQTLVTSERFTFPELEKIERLILEADEIIQKIEEREFNLMVKESLNAFEEFIELSKQIGELDLVLSLCLCKEEYNWTKPEINEEGKIYLEDSRHPVVERYLPVGEKFITNTISLDKAENSIAILTGPNMAGKSTFMRQIALCQILFQMGSFVPVKSANMCLVDKIFTRIGSGDNLTSGESTFFLEMKETAYILKNKTPNSLVLFDEIGRGTSTYDGMSIAWSIIEYLNKNYSAGKRTKTIFATHYHELTELERESGIFNLYMDTVEKDDEIIFMKKVKKGKAKKSFGIYVAKLAGLPDIVINRSKEILMGLESRKKIIQFKAVNSEPDLFPVEAAAKQDPKIDSIRRKLKDININNITPIEALQILNDLKREAI